MQRKPPPEGYIRHHLDPNLVRKLPDRTAASDFFPNLKSAAQWREEQQKKEQAWIERKGGKSR